MEAARLVTFACNLCLVLTTVLVEGTSVSDDGVLENSLFHNLRKMDCCGTCKGNNKYTCIYIYIYIYIYICLDYTNLKSTNQRYISHRHCISKIFSRWLAMGCIDNLWIQLYQKYSSWLSKLYSPLNLVSNLCMKFTNT